jgi:hypothetical protein
MKPIRSAADVAGEVMDRVEHLQINELLAHHCAWRPPILLGDVVLFNQFAPHLTYLGNPSKPRVASEIRMIAKEPMVLEEYARNGIPYFTLEAGGIKGLRRARIGNPIEVLPE